MKYVALFALAWTAALPALAHESAVAGNGCHDDLAGGSYHCHGPNVFVGANVRDVPISPADADLRSPVAPQSNFTAKTIEDDQVFAAQVILQKNGCYDGRLDGVLGPGTVYALKLFEANMGLAITGQPNGATGEALRLNHDRFDICR
ncbi:MAG: peptidoglycan-binding protein [Pseudomonadota bacterium]